MLKELPFYALTAVSFLDAIFNPEEIRERVLNTKIQIDLLENAIPNDIKNNINCKYYDENNFRKLAQGKTPLFSLFNLNIRSFNKHADELNLYLETLSHKFDLISLTEAGNSDNLNTHVANLGKYNLYFDQGNNTFSGAALLVKENINVIQVRKDLSIKQVNKEILADYKLEEIWVECKFQGIKDSVIFGVIYRHPNSNINIFNKGLESVISKIQKEKKDLRY